MPETMGERIQQAISYRGLKQGEAARLIGISAQYLSDIIYGRKNASKRLKYSTAQALKISPEWLIDGIGSMEQTTAGDVSDLALLASEITASEFRERKILREQEIEGLKRALEGLEGQNKKVETTKVSTDDIKAILRNGSPQEVNSLLKILIDRIEYSKPSRKDDPSFTIIYARS